jgi:ParB family transcriptional regulator, chromosome partitioning protein
MSDDEVATAEALRAECDKLEQAHSDADELSEDVDRRLGEIEPALAALDDRPVRYDPEQIAHASAFVSIDSSGALRVERGYVRPGVTRGRGRARKPADLHP